MRTLIAFILFVLVSSCSPKTTGENPRPRRRIYIEYRLQGHPYRPVYPRPHYYPLPEYPKADHHPFPHHHYGPRR